MARRSPNRPDKQHYQHTGEKVVSDALLPYLLLRFGQLAYRRGRQVGLKFPNDPQKRHQRRHIRLPDDVWVSDDLTEISYRKAAV